MYRGTSYLPTTSGWAFLAVTISALADYSKWYKISRNNLYGNSVYVFGDSWCGNGTRWNHLVFDWKLSRKCLVWASVFVVIASSIGLFDQVLGSGKKSISHSNARHLLRSSQCYPCCVWRVTRGVGSLLFEQPICWRPERQRGCRNGRIRGLACAGDLSSANRGQVVFASLLHTAHQLSIYFFDCTQCLNAGDGE